MRPVQVVDQRSIPTIPKSNKRIRDASTKTPEVQNSHFTVGVHNHLSLSGVHESTASTSRSSAIGLIHLHSHKPNVTPSPQFTATPVFVTNVSSSTIKTMPRVVTHHLTNSVDDVRVKPVQGHYSNAYITPSNSQYAQRQSHPVPSSSHLSRERILQTSSKIPNHSGSWKRLKAQQQKSQQRAFLRPSDNPFKNYNHDPNDSESYLDQLTCSENTTVSTSIIPLEGFLAIDASRKPQLLYPSNSLFESNTINQFEIHQRRRLQEINVDSIPDILSQKAAESNSHIMNAMQNESTISHQRYATNQDLSWNRYPAASQQMSTPLPIRMAPHSISNTTNPSQNYYGNNREIGPSAYNQYFSHQNTAQLVDDFQRAMAQPCSHGGNEYRGMTESIGMNQQLSPRFNYMLRERGQMDSQITIYSGYPPNEPTRNVNQAFDTNAAPKPQSQKFKHH
jgi:hypothetical protein